MPLKKLIFKAGVNKENTRYTSENGWYDCDKVRFRQGTPEKIGGWVRLSASKFLGIASSLLNWVTLNSLNLLGVGTNLKFYIEQGGIYSDITPLRDTVTLTNPFAITNGSSVITVTDANGGYVNNDFVIFYESTAIGNFTVLGEYQLTYSSGSTYTINMVSEVDISIAAPAVFTAQFKLANDTPVTLTTTGQLPSPFDTTTTYYVVNTSGYTFQLSLTVGGSAISTAGQFQSGIHTATAFATSTVASGGGSVITTYLLNTGSAAATPVIGWGAGLWGLGTWGGIGAVAISDTRSWSQSNFGQDLVFGPRGGKMYYWNAFVGYLPASFTISIASPAVITSSVSLIDGTAISFETTGSLPTNIDIGTIYYVVNSLGSTFNVAATPGGTPINTTGSQSGTHYISPRALPVEDLAGASNVPLTQNIILVSDTSRFVFCFGTNDYLSTEFDPMLIRWSDQESVTNWTPAATNQAGSLRLSNGSEIVTAIQTRQEILVLTDQSIYSLQYLQPPLVWGSQILGDNISIVGANAISIAAGVAFWMGTDKFYKYDGRVQTLRCDLRQYIYGDINREQFGIIFSGTNEGFNEVWWFYCSAGSSTINRYVVYNYLDDIWYYGEMARTAWLDSGLRDYPMAATYQNNIVYHELGVDDEVGDTPLPIESYITSAQFDLDDGHNFSFVWRVLPDLTFRGSSAASPSLTMYLKPMKNSGSGYTTPPSVGGYASKAVTRTAVLPIEEFTGQIYTRVRGRQLAIEVRSTDVGVTWQLGAPRLDIRPDGRR